MDNVVADEKIKEAVRQTYGGIARRFEGEPGAGRASCCGPSREKAVKGSQSDCCGPSQGKAAQKSQSACCGSAEVEAEASTPEVDAPTPEVDAPTSKVGGGERFYSTEELDGLPETVTDASLGCGNPLAIAGLRPGESVLDLGSGGGIDCFLAARQVGPEGRVIGLDMTPDMIKLARRNAKKMGVTNVDFRFGEMEDMPLPDESVDAIISNCVVNLSPDKDAVFGEAYRVLRPGGRLSISDMVVDGELPQTIRESLDAWAGCIAGALDEGDYLAKIQAAGFEGVEVLSRDYAEIDEVTEWDEVQAVVARPDGSVVEGEEAQALLSGAGLSPADLAQKVASIKVQAYKPGGTPAS